MHVVGTPRAWLRLEGAAVTIVSLLAFQAVSGRWGVFAALILVPDVAMLGYLGGPVLGARIYNTAHSYVGPMALLGYAFMSSSSGGIWPWALIWLAHIGIDRMLGYGLKYPAAFGETHLGRIGKATRD